MHWIALILTAVILAALGQTLVAYAKAGDFWIFPVVWAVTAVGIYKLGADEDREAFHRLGRWIIEKLSRR